MATTLKGNKPFRFKSNDSLILHYRDRLIGMGIESITVKHEIMQIRFKPVSQTNVVDEDSIGKASFTMYFLLDFDVPVYFTRPKKNMIVLTYFIANISFTINIFESDDNKASFICEIAGD